MRADSLFIDYCHEKYEKRYPLFHLARMSVLDWKLFIKCYAFQLFQNQLFGIWFNLDEQSIFSNSALSQFCILTHAPSFLDNCNSSHKLINGYENWKRLLTPCCQLNFSMFRFSLSCEPLSSLIETMSFEQSLHGTWENYIAGCSFWKQGHCCGMAVLIKDKCFSNTREWCKSQWVLRSMCLVSYWSTKLYAVKKNETGHAHFMKYLQLPNFRLEDRYGKVNKLRTVPRMLGSKTDMGPCV